VHACRSLSDNKARQEVIMAKWCKPIGRCGSQAADGTMEVGKYQKRLEKLFGPPQSTGACKKKG
jgi:hypothetical protein